MEGLRTPLREGQLVRRLIEQGIRDPRVLAAFARVPRRFFVPDEAQPYSEGDHPLEIGYGQTISQPYIVAAMTEALQLEGRERVLEVGTGSSASATARAAGPKPPPTMPSWSRRLPRKCLRLFWSSSRPVAGWSFRWGRIPSTRSCSSGTSF